MLTPVLFSAACVFPLSLLSLSPALRVNDMTLASSSNGALPPSVHRKVWVEVLRQLTMHLVDSYAKAKKCTTEGRGLMTLDLSALRSGLEKLSGIKPLPYWDHVLSYVNAFYLPESELLSWVSAHPHYSLAALQSVAECGCGSSKPKKDRMALLAAVAAAHAEAVARTLADRAAAKLKHQRAQSGVGISLAPEGAAVPSAVPAATAAAAGAGDAASTASTVPASASAVSGAGSSSRLPSAPSSLPTSKPGSKAGSRAGSRAPSRPLTPTSALDLSQLHGSHHAAPQQQQHHSRRASTTQAAAATQEDDLP